jgi:hypothetical protein
MEALRALQAVVLPVDFWSPEVLDHADLGAVEALIAETVRGTMAADQLPALRALKDLPAWERVIQAGKIRVGEPHLENDLIANGIRRAAMYAAGVPLELTLWAEESGNIQANHTELSWLPEDLHVPGHFGITQCARLKRIPKGLSAEYVAAARCAALEEVGEGFTTKSTADFEGCPNLRLLSPGMKIGGGLRLPECPRLDALADGLEVGRDLDLWQCLALARVGKQVKIRGEEIWISKTGLMAWRESELRKALGFRGRFMYGSVEEPLRP